MALEDLLGPDVFWGALNRDWPLGTDPKSQGDDHIRGVKNVALNTNPRVNAAQDWSAVESNQIIPALNALITAVYNQAIGSVEAFAIDGIANTDPYILCDGQAISRTAYPILFGIIGVAFGVGDGANTFNVPDYRGYFLRAVDRGAGVDPNAATRTARADGTAGDNAGTEQPDEFRAHFHTVFPAGAASAGYQIAGPMPQSTGNTSTEGGAETRPKNIYVDYGIKGDWQGTPVALITPEDDPV